jgi:very-short-patch-repair endonuclease
MERGLGGEDTHNTMKPIPIIRNPAVTAEKAALAKRLRQTATPEEVQAWDMLRGRRCLGLKFRRQQVILGFIVDFYCAEHRLAVELDGDVHDQQEEHDRLRDEALAQADVRVLRIRNEELSVDRLRALILAALSELRQSSPPNPLSILERGDQGNQGSQGS